MRFIQIIPKLRKNNMAKLYAEIASDKGGRNVGKGGNERIEILLKTGNEPHAIITMLPSGNVVLEALSPSCAFIDVDSDEYSS